MSWSELLGRDVCLDPSPHDQARFGVSVDRATVPAGHAGAAEEVLAVVGSSTADVVVLRYPAERVDLFARLRGSGREPILADSLVYWRLETGAGRRPRPEAGLVAAEEHLEADVVAELVGDVFAGYRSHYVANPLFDEHRALAGYQEWATRSVVATEPVTLREEDRLVAFATLATEDGALEIELAGVRASAQRGGRYGHLLAGVEDVAARRGIPQVVISTQGHNTKVQRAWARYGFEPVAQFLTVHLVRAGLLP